MPTVGTDTVQTPRVDAVPKVTGRAVYTEDLPLPPGTLYGAILRSPYAHARLATIDAQRAERLPGVHAVVTREHLGPLNPFLDPAAYGAEGAGTAPLIALEKVRYEGEPVAAVAAETPVLAQQALACIEVVYDDLPVLFDTREALKPDAPVIHDQRPGNLVGQFDFGWGDIEQGFRASDHIFEDTYVFQSVFHHPMENLGGCIADGQQILRQAQRHYEEVLQPVDDLHGSVTYKTYLTGVLLGRALAQAVGSNGRQCDGRRGAYVAHDAGWPPD